MKRKQRWTSRWSADRQRREPGAERAEVFEMTGLFDDALMEVNAALALDSEYLRAIECLGRLQLTENSA